MRLITVRWTTTGEGTLKGCDLFSDDPSQYKMSINPWQTWPSQTLECGIIISLNVNIHCERTIKRYYKIAAFLYCLLIQKIDRNNILKLDAKIKKYLVKWSHKEIQWLSVQKSSYFELSIFRRMLEKKIFREICHCDTVNNHWISTSSCHVKVEVRSVGKKYNNVLQSQQAWWHGSMSIRTWAFWSTVTTRALFTWSIKWHWAACTAWPWSESWYFKAGSIMWKSMQFMCLGKLTKFLISYPEWE